MWIVRLALNRPYTFVVASLVLLLLTPFILLRMPTDIFPAINIPVVSIVWQYAGLDAQEIEQRMNYIQERSLTTTVNDIEHIEGNAYNGIGVIKVFLREGSSVDAGVAQVTAIAQTVIRSMPPGTTPPLIIRYSASTVPILQYSISSPKLSEQEIFDLSANQIRVGLATVRGAAMPWPYGGKNRIVSVDLDLSALKAKNLAPVDVVNAVNSQNLVFPSGTAKIGGMEYSIGLNTSPRVMEELGDLPIKVVNGALIRLRDVAQVRDGYQPQQNIVRQGGVRGALLTIYKSGAASTLDVVSGIKKALPGILSGLTSDLEVKEFADQSIFVRSAIEGVVREGVIAAALTALMILLFLGSWRSTFIIALSIPLSVLSSIAVLSALGETINLMTLGGLALAVGILVDDATVAIENIHRHMVAGKPLNNAILDGASEIAMPAFVSTLCICIVFLPMFFLTGVAHYLFVPLAEAVVFAMLASYVLSRTLIPTLVMWFYRNVEHGSRGQASANGPSWLRPFSAVQNAFERGFDRFREGYRVLLGAVLHHRIAFATVFLLFCGGTCLLIPQLGQDFFPLVDAGHFRLHLRARSGTRIEETAKLVDQVEASLRQEIPPAEFGGMLDNIGLPSSSINLTYNDSGLIGTGDADILVSLRDGHRPTPEHVRRLRIRLQREFPGITFYFLPADIVSQSINFGLPAPFDIQLVGRDQGKIRALAARLADKIRQVPGAVDVRVQQPADLPKLQFAIDRTKAAEIGLCEKDVANSVLLSLSGSGQVQPVYWLNPQVGIQYLVNIRTPEYRMDSLAALNSIPVNASQPGAGDVQLLANVATVTRASSAPLISHYNVMPVIDVFGGVSGRDLGGVLNDLKPLIAQAEKELPRGSSITLRGQAETMRSSFVGLSIGLVMAMVLIYLLLVVNFQSWLDPFIIITALPGALAGVVWALHLTLTTGSVPALMGAIMSLGVATANSVLVVTFARSERRQGKDPLTAVWDAGASRLRPVLMTATAMIIGMFPMALGLGEGGEQNAPLGRAVIGGLIVATIATLFFVPVVFALLHRRAVAPGGAALAVTPPEAGFGSSAIAQSAAKLRHAAIAAAVLVIIGGIAGLVPRWHQRRVLDAETRELATPTVRVVSPKAGNAATSLALPAEVKPLVEAPIYARACGYLKRWHADIGVSVKAGQLLAEIDTPELNQELASSRAEFARAEAALVLAKTTAARWAELSKTASVSEQEAAEKQADLVLKTATVEATRAGVRRLEDLQSFSRVTAPFAGVITARKIDVGDLISSNADKELFRLAQTGTLRVYVHVPQSSAKSATPGQNAELTIMEMPGRAFPAKVVRTAGAMDARSRTLLVELEVDNSRGEILAGTYAQVRFVEPQADGALMLPADMLIMRPEGPQVGIVLADNKVELRNVILGRDFGSTVEILKGLNSSDRVIANPPDSLISGIKVRVFETKL